MFSVTSYDLVVDVRDSVMDCGRPLPLWMTVSIGAEDSCTDTAPSGIRELLPIEPSHPKTHSQLGQYRVRHSIPNPGGVEDNSPGSGEPLRRTLSGVQSSRSRPAAQSVICRRADRRARTWRKTGKPVSSKPARASVQNGFVQMRQPKRARARRAEGAYCNELRD